jgi:cold shock CspA family protein
VPFHQNILNESGYIHFIEPSSLSGNIHFPHFAETLYFNFKQVVGGNPTLLQQGHQVDAELMHEYPSGRLRVHRVYPRMPPPTAYHPAPSYRPLSHPQPPQQQYQHIKKAPPPSLERQIGKVDSEPSSKRRDSSPYPGSMEQSPGRIIYEKNSECFFVHFHSSGVDGDKPVHVGDEVSFLLAKDPVTHATQAVSVKLEKSVSVKKIQGLIKTLKESFGFIERADVSGTVFFHASEAQDESLDGLWIGAPVEFVLQNRQGKDVATQIRLLPPGTVNFDEVQEEVCRGVIRKPVQWVFNQKKNKIPSNDDGEILYQSTNDGLLTLSYNGRDQVGCYTMSPGDQVTFNVAVDKRTQAKHATNVSVTKLTEVQRCRSARDKGIVGGIQDMFGYIECSNKEVQAAFHLSEVMDTNAELTVGDEVEYSPVITKDKDSGTDRTLAARIQLLPQGSVKFDAVTTQVYEGTVAEELTSTPDEATLTNPLRLLFLKTEECGSIHYTGRSGSLGTVPFFCSSDHPELEFGDRVQFRIAKVKRTREQRAVEIKILRRARDIRFKGCISRLIKKEGYGFIESEEHDCEIFFSYSSFEGDASSLHLLDEVEYCVLRKGGKTSAEKIVRLPHGSVPKDELDPTISGPLSGEVVRTLRNPDPSEYEGSIKYTDPHNPGCTLEYPYTVTSLVDVKNLPKLGEQVHFDVAVVAKTGTKRAVNVSVKREVMKGTIHTVKDQYGFIVYYSDGEKISVFFHKSNIDKGDDLKPGDEVEFVVSFSSKSEKHQAICVKKTGSSRRPLRLSRNSLTNSRNQHASNSVVVIRQPRGPDGTKGFAAES